MVRLLRLGRMITFLKANQKLKFSMKFGQLLFFLVLIIHWINWIWFYTVNINETWYPPKDLDSKVTKAYSASGSTQYILFYYYGVITLVGNELLPTVYYELLCALFLVFLATVVIGLVIGEFTYLMSNFTKSQREANEELDIINTLMVNLRLSEELQNRVSDYYDKMTESRFIKNTSIYDLLSLNFANQLKTFQVIKWLRKINFINSNYLRQVESFSSYLSIKFYLAGDLIIGQGTLTLIIFRQY